MYRHILVPVEHSDADKTILAHAQNLARMTNAKLLLLHVADGWAARTYGPDAVSPEIAADTAYLQTVRAEFQSMNIPIETELAFGDPVQQIVKWVEEKGCDLVAMSTHGHRFLADLFLGTTASRVQHQVSVPVLLLRAK